MTKKIRNVKRWTLSLLLISFAALASIITINASDAPYKDLSNVRDASIHQMGELKDAAAYQIAAAYRLLHGPSTLPTGSVFKVIWLDGSSENFLISSFLSGSTNSIPGTQSAGGGGGGGGGWEGGGGDEFGGGGDFWDGCFITGTTACTSVGGGGQHCEVIETLQC